MHDKLETLLNVLTKDRKQLDQDGIRVGVSRQALDEAIATIRHLVEVLERRGEILYGRDGD